MGNMDSIANNTKQLFTFYWWDQMYRITEIFDRYYMFQSGYYFNFIVTPKNNNDQYYFKSNWLLYNAHDWYYIKVAYIFQGKFLILDSLCLALL